MTFEYLGVLRVPVKRFLQIIEPYILHVTHSITLIRRIAKLLSCGHAAKVFSRRMKNTTNWAIVYMAWKNHPTNFLIDATSYLGTISRLNHTQVPCMSHHRSQRCSDSNLTTFWNLELETSSNKSVDLFMA